MIAVVVWLNVARDGRHRLSRGVSCGGTWITSVSVIVCVVLTNHGIEHLFLVDRLSGHLGMRVLLGVVDGERMRLGYGGRVPGRLMMGRVGVNGGRISPCVHGRSVR